MRKHLLFLLVIALLAACNSSDKKTDTSTDIGVATTFIRNLLDNDMKGAEALLLKDEANGQYFDIIKQRYGKLDKTELEKYKNSDIIINELSKVADSVSVVNYSNSYNKDSKNIMKVVRVNNQWLVDLKYTFSGNL